MNHIAGGAKSGGWGASCLGSRRSVQPERTAPWRGVKDTVVVVGGCAAKEGRFSSSAGARWCRGLGPGRQARRGEPVHRVLEGATAAQQRGGASAARQQQRQARRRMERARQAGRGGGCCRSPAQTLITGGQKACKPVACAHARQRRPCVVAGPKNGRKRMEAWANKGPACMSGDRR